MHCLREKLVLTPGSIHLQIHLHADEVLSQTIVELTRELAAFRVLYLE
jgi:hypothetical protein